MRRSNQNESQGPFYTAEIQVIGKGVVQVQPDTALLRVGVETEDASLQKAQRQNAQQSENLLQALYGLGIDKDSVATVDYSIYPQYDYQTSGSSQIKGYQVRHLFLVTIKPPSATGKVIDEAVNSGATLVQSIEFTVNDTGPAEQQALQLAYQDAYTKASILAQAAGYGNEYQLVPVQFYEELEQTSVPVPFQSMVKSAATPVTPPSTLSVSASIGVIFHL
ncbi:SIMPL domain-containing protein [Mangrovibacillus cuniculi]|uniref:SIMPL domain-containing protein n=1 Tax=Mangrovibacillus cuniculi TaxID=2593652 RepID=A0A7S8HEX9_9BACI|nr:SIMPL domain-containing protein [Mangrovibacillus cuniculi]QPC45830.1 SIMPL domain-containing protein [Mangrovibacillus cuniculi]